MSDDENYLPFQKPSIPMTGIYIFNAETKESIKINEGLSANAAQDFS